MNKEYIYHDGNVIIRDENNVERTCEYSNNLDETLVQENLVEEIEDKICELEKKDKDLNLKSLVIMDIILNLSVFIGVPLFIYFISAVSYINGVNTVINTTWGVIEVWKLVSIVLNSALIGLFLIPYDIFGIIRDVRIKKEKKGISNELNYLRERLLQEKDKLEELQQVKAKENPEKGFRITQVNDKKILEMLHGKIKLYYDCGYNGKKYYKYFKKGILEEKLSGKYSKEELEEIKRYLVMNEERYVKKKTK